MFCILIRYLCYFTRPTLFNRPTTLPSKPSARFQEWQSRSTREELHEALDYVSSLVMFLKKRKETVPHSTSVSFVTVSFRFFFFARTTRPSLLITVVLRFHQLCSGEKVIWVRHTGGGGGGSAFFFCQNDQPTAAAFNLWIYPINFGLHWLFFCLHGISWQNTSTLPQFRDRPFCTLITNRSQGTNQHNKTPLLLETEEASSKGLKAVPKFA